MKFYSINKSQLSKEIFSLLGIQNSDSKLQIDEFSDGEFQPVFRESIRDQIVYILADGSSSADIIKLCLTIDAAKRSGAYKVNVIYPFAPYSRQDKLKNGIRSSISARALADMLQSVGLNKLITIELHAGSIMGMYNVPVIHLNGNKIFTNYLKSLNLEDVCVCSPDAGAVERNKDLSKIFKNPLAALIEKTRIKFNEISSMVLIGEENIKNKNVFICDDILDTGGTLSKSSHILKEKGALSIRAVIPHFVASGKALENIFNSAIDELIVSDTVAKTYEKVELYESKFTSKNSFGIIPKIKVVSSAELISNSIQRLNQRMSINELNYESI
jgi:ribose-phosphate pyrophosphokinase